MSKHRMDEQQSRSVAFKHLMTFMLRVRICECVLRAVSVALSGAPDDLDAKQGNDVCEGQLNTGSIQVWDLEGGPAEGIHQQQVGSVDEVVAITLCLT
eukprot:1118098-Pelagomonas_calceolata.AAC.5